VLPQRAASTYRLTAVLDMDSNQTSRPRASITSEVLPDDKGFGRSWTDAHPAFRFHLDESEGWQFEAKTSAVDAVLAKTGPQTARFLVNGETVKTIRLDCAGSYDFHLPLAARHFTQPASTAVELIITPCLTQPPGGPFCVWLHRIGFTRDLHGVPSEFCSQPCLSTECAGLQGNFFSIFCGCRSGAPNGTSWNL
jgi:hypothetical protein